jgi:hypothetical protein
MITIKKIIHHEKRNILVNHGFVVETATMIGEKSKAVLALGIKQLNNQ